MAIFRDGELFQNPIVRIVAQARHKEHTLIGEPLIPLVVHITAVKDQDGAGSKLPFTRYFDLRGFSFGDHRIARQMAIMIQNQVQLGRAFGLLVVGPVKHAGAEIDNRAVDAQQGVAKTETVPRAGHLLATRKQNAKDFLIQRPGTMLVGIGERGLVGCLGHAKMLQLAFATR